MKNRYLYAEGHRKYEDRPDRRTLIGDKSEQVLGGRHGGANLRAIELERFKLTMKMSYLKQNGEIMFVWLLSCLVAGHLLRNDFYFIDFRKLIIILIIFERKEDC